MAHVFGVSSFGRPDLPYHKASLQPAEPWLHLGVCTFRSLSEPEATRVHMREASVSLSWKAQELRGSSGA